MRAKILDVSYVAHMSGDWLKLEFRYYELYSPDSPLPIRTKVCSMPMMRELAYEHMRRIFDNPFWAYQGKAREGGDFRVWYTFVHTSKKGMNYDDVIAEWKEFGIVPRLLSGYTRTSA